MSRPRPTRRTRPTTTTWADAAVEFGHNLARARAKLRLSQEGVAQRAGISAFTYQKYEKGESRPGSPANPTLTVLVALSQALEVPVAKLLPSKLPDLTSGELRGRR